MKSYIIEKDWLLDYKGKASHLVMPRKVTKISAYAFYACKSLTSVKIPSSMKRIGTGAFEECTNLTNITIPKSVTFIGDDAFLDIKRVKTQWITNDVLRAFKVFNADWTCRKFQYEVGKSYHQDGIIKCCGNGFHACTNPLNVFNYYCGDLSALRFAEVELSGKMEWAKDKVAASDIRIVRELTASELAEIYNSMEKE